MNSFLSDILNQKLEEELSININRNHYQRNKNDNRKRNGHKIVKIKGIFQNLIIKKPVLRTATPPSKILSFLKNISKNFIILLASRFWLRGTSTDATAKELNSIFGTKLHPSDISNFSNLLLPDLLHFLQKPITQPFQYIFLDATYIPFYNKIQTNKAALLVALGLNPNGSKSVLGFLLGDKESTDSWSALLDDLINRGLNLSSIKLIISDHHNAIISAVKHKINKPHQLCIVHKLRNTLCRIRNNIHKKEFLSDFKDIFFANSKDEALIALGKLKAKWYKLYPNAVNILLNNFNQSILFMDQPNHLWKTIRSTNLIERFIRELKRRLNPAGTMLSENQLFKLIASVAYEQELRWNKRKNITLNPSTSSKEAA
ncbi:MAG: IS256 family transposase [Chitinispirillaceae bacterium]|nr:IS256 family transposase [Chitinispirillaceae bacterium]